MIKQKYVHFLYLLHPSITPDMIALLSTLFPTTMKTKKHLMTTFLSSILSCGGYSRMFSLAIFPYRFGSSQNRSVMRDVDLLSARLALKDESSCYSSSFNPTHINFNWKLQQSAGYFTMIPVPDNSATIW